MAEEFRKTLAWQLREYRKARRMTQEDLAERAGVAVRTISDVERGVSLTPHRHTLIALADALALTGTGRADFVAAGRETALIGGAHADLAPQRSLPRDIASFTAREAELAQLTSLAQRAGTPGLVGVYVIDGMPGVGKTSLALHAAHRIADQYPDGQIFLDLHGYTDGLEPLTAGEALGSLLRSLGVADQVIPDGTADRASFYRSRLAGTRTLIILDNALNSAQVRPLLPGTAGCLVMITSRRKIQGLDDAEPVGVGQLAEQEAIALLRRVAGPGRVLADDPAAARMAELCGYLPLAVRMIAARLRHRQALLVTDVLDQMVEERRRLAHLRDDDRDLGAVFDVSFRHLPAAEQRAFVLLGLVPGPDFDARVLAALDGADEDTAEGLLESLLDHNLLVQRTSARYLLHDLVRVYARGLAGDRLSLLAPGEADAAVARLLDYYVRAAQAADSYLERRLPDVDRPVTAPPATASPLVVPDLDRADRTDRADRADRARAWLAAELPSLDAAVRHALGGGRYPQAAALASALAHYLRAYGPWTTAAALHGAVAQAARQAGDTRGEAAALAHLAAIQRQAGALVHAEQNLAAGLDRFRALGDPQGQAAVLVELGIVRRLTGAAAAAQENLTEALDGFRALGDPQGQAAALAELGSVLRQTGRFAEAEQALTAALGLYREIGNRNGEASALAYLGGALWSRGALSAAEESLVAALDISRELNDPTGEANYLLYLGGVHRDAGVYGKAAECLTAALHIYARLGDRRGRAGALALLGAVRRLTGQDEEATSLLTEALALFRELNDLGGVAETLNNYAALKSAAGDQAAARDHYAEALDLARAIASSKDEADALAGIGDTCRRQGETALAAEHYRQALTLYRAMDCATDAATIEASLAALAPPDLPA